MELNHISCYNAYVNTHKSQKIEFSVNIYENAIPQIIFLDGDKSRRNLITESTNIELRQFFQHPFREHLQFEHEVNNPITNGAKPYDLDIRHRTLYIQPDVRGMEYQIRITASDSNFDTSHAMMERITSSMRIQI